MICAFLASAGAMEAGAKSRKRGFSGFLGDHWTCSDGDALNLKDSWYYTWGTGNSQIRKCGSLKMTAEFVPMVIGVSKAKNINMTTLKDEWTRANVRYLLGYNEPDYGNGHNHPHMSTPAQAAEDWPQVQTLANMFDPPLELVGPAVSSGAESGGSDAWDADGKSTWLDEFFGNCTDVVQLCDPSSIKYIAMHDYRGNVTALERRISGAVKRYGGRKLWLTEFAITHWGAPPAREKQDAFMKEALPYLDASEDVFRYNWFSARNVPNGQNGGSNLLLSDSNSTKPTSSGAIYASRETLLIV